MKKKRCFLLVTVILVVCIVMSLMTIVNAVTFATAMGTTCLGLNTTVHMNDAANAYRNSGYTSVNTFMDPSYLLLISNLAAEVQYFATHGNYDNIRFTNCGINLYDDLIIGNTEYIGTNSINLWQNTLLVTYGTCCSAGVEGTFQHDSMAYETALRGAETVVGFTDDICIDCFDWWSYRYNTKLSQGEGVLEAAEFASSYSYEHNTVKQFQVIHHGDPNITIGEYNSNSGLNSTRESSGETKIINNKRIKATNENILNLVKQQNKISNIDDIEIERNYAGVTNVLKGKTEVIEYIDVKEKIGGYATNSGFTLKCKDGFVEEITDNTVEKTKITDMNVNFESKLDCKIEEFEERAIKDVLIKYNNEVEIIEEEINTEYFYDLENGKKYVSVTVKTNAGTDGKDAYGIDCFKYEI